MSAAAGLRCLDDELLEYAAGRLPESRVAVWQRHLAVCDLCTVGLERERRLQAALAGAPSMPGDLRTALMAMGRSLDQQAPRPRGPEPLALLAPGAPPCHRSPLRATAVAAAAVGLSAAAAWSLAVMGSPADRGAVSRPTVRDAATSPSPPPTTVAGGGTTMVRWMPVGSALPPAGQQAQSTP
jgi:anti-sigma factor RsiW